MSGPPPQPSGIRLSGVGPGHKCPFKAFPGDLVCWLAPPYPGIIIAMLLSVLSAQLTGSISASLAEKFHYPLYKEAETELPGLSNLSPHSPAPGCLLKAWVVLDWGAPPARTVSFKASGEPASGQADAKMSSSWGINDIPPGIEAGGLGAVIYGLGLLLLFDLT